MSLGGAFNEVFGKEDKYFGEWFIKADDSLTVFLENNLTTKENFGGISTFTLATNKPYFNLHNNLKIFKGTKAKRAHAINVNPSLVSISTWQFCIDVPIYALRITKDRRHPSTSSPM